MLCRFVDLLFADILDNDLPKGDREMQCQTTCQRQAWGGETLREREREKLSEQAKTVVVIFRALYRRSLV